VEVTNVQIPVGDRINFKNALIHWARQSPERLTLSLMEVPLSGGLVMFSNVPKEFADLLGRALHYRDF